MSQEKEFDWDLLEIEDRRSKGQLTKEDYKKIGYSDDDMSAYSKTFEDISSIPIKDEIIEGIIVDINGNTGIIDFNSIQEAYFDLKKEDKDLKEYLEVGNKVKVKVNNNPEKAGYIHTSFTAAIKTVKKKEILDSIEKRIGYLGKVTDLIQGGYIVIIDGIETFMPGSLAGINKLHDFNVLLGKSIIVVPVNYERDNIVVSHREYLKSLIPEKIEQLKSNISDKITGTVTGSTKYGIFCEFNTCLTGMILSSELSATDKARHEKRLIRPGDEIDFYVKEIITNNKIILTQNEVVNPWHGISDRYSVPQHTTGKIISVKGYGVFIEIEKGLVGLLHKSEYEGIELKQGEDIHVKIREIDIDNQKIHLTLID